MKFWRKQAEGFDWHAYVRTTIHLRREQRRARLDEIGRVAAGQAKAAGGAAIQGVAQAAETGWRASAAAWRKTIGQPAVALPVVLTGGVALLSGLHRWFTVGWDAGAALPLGVGAILLLLVAPLALARASAAAWRRLISVSGVVGSKFLPPALVAVLALALGWFAWGRVTPSGLSAAGNADQGKAGTALAALEGKAVALSGEMIRLQGHLLHLSGIEAPDGLQTCTRADKQSWRCGEAALAALERLARTRTFHCVLHGAPDATGRHDANCTVDGRDVAGELVKAGHVFSAATVFGGYAALETEARRAGTGLWSGDAERPAEYRAKLWAAAQANTPDGCPIKSQIDAGRKTYLMPWASHYGSASVRVARGERWFCSEADAQAAGFKPAPIRKVATR